MAAVLLLGASGLLGAHLAARLPASCATVAPRPRHGEPDRRSAIGWLTTHLDATDDRSLEATLDEAAADVVVNAIGLRAGDRSSLDSINARFPHRLASLVGARGGRVIHISTDGVFSGARGDYSETDSPDPGDDYGRSKLAGELPAP